MNLNQNQIKSLINLLVLCCIFPQATSVLSFTYPQSTTLSNYNILVVEKDGIYSCSPDFSRKVETLHTFSEEDKITNESKLSKTLIKKSSYTILILSNYKIYIIKTSTGELLYNSEDKLITDEEPEYVDLSYIYSTHFYFAISYIDSNKNLVMKYYEYLSDYYDIHFYGTYSLNSVTREYDSNSYTFNFQKKGLSCDNMVDYSNDRYTYITCFIVANDGEDDYIIPITFDDENLVFVNNAYAMQRIKVNNNKQIKTETNADMTIAYVCYVTEQNKGACSNFYMTKSNGKGNFYYPQTFSKDCRSDIYGMTVKYIFETGDILFSCSDLDGSFQVRIIKEDGNVYNYKKYENCSSIYGYSVIYLSGSRDYYVTSDVTCPEGMIPYNILIDSSSFNPEYISIDSTNKETKVDTSSISSTIITDKIIQSTQVENIVNESTNKITVKIPETSIVTEKVIETEKIPETSIVTEKPIETEKISTIVNHENIRTTQLINLNNNERTEEVNHCPEMCLECNSQQKCTKCNKNKNYYPIELTAITPESYPSQTIVECINAETKEIKHPNFYLDPESESFKPCYENCATCYGKGDGNNNNCKTCEPGYILHPEYENSKDCVPKPNSLYYMKYDQYTITNSDICPEGYSFLIKEKSKCIEDCKLDNKYTYTYDGLCYEQPPENTNDDDGDHKCKDNPNTCLATRKELYTLNDTITDLEIELLILKYSQEYDYTNYHITIYENDIYIITIYKNGECLSELGILTKMIDFGDCYNEIHSKNSIPQNKNLIVAQIETKPGKESYKRNPSYGLYHPEGGHSLNFESECREQKVTIQNNLTEQFNNSKVSFDNIKLMADSGLDLFDPTCPFYNDLCTHYPDILGKDIPLEKRILAYYPDIELCEDNCDLAFVFLNNKTAKCECPISGEGGKLDKLKENSLYKNELGYFEELFYSTNINVIKCYKDLFKQEYFVKCYGGFIILGLIFIQIMCTLIYCTKSRFHLKKYFFNITNKYLNYLKNKNPMKNIGQKPQMIKGGDIGKISKICIPPRKSVKAPSGVDIFVKKQNKPNNINQKNQKGIIPFDNSTDKITMNNSTNQRRKPKLNTFKKRQTNFGINHKLSGKQSDSDNLMNNISDELDIKIEEFLKTDLEDMDYDDAIRRDKRTFCVYYGEKIQSEQMILNTFCHKEYLKPMPIKIILLVLQVELYFFINGLFYNEEYVTKIFELEKDTFGNKTWRFLDNLFYAFIVGVIINYVIEFFFIQEKKIRVTLKREKNNLLILKYEMVQIIKDLQKRFLSFIIVSFIVSVFIWYHISCFNNVYKHMKDEWLVFSILIIVCIQLLSLVTCLIETILRFLSFRFKSEKLFKLSLIFS
jgi:hypothetical protein